MDLLTNILAVSLGVVIVELVFAKRAIKKAKAQIIQEMTDMINRNEEVTLTISKKDVSHD